MPKYVVTENTPGYLPESEPQEFDNASDAKSFMQDLINELLDDGYMLCIRQTWFARLEQSPDDLGRIVEIMEV